METQKQAYHPAVVPNDFDERLILLKLIIHQYYWVMMLFHCYLVSENKQNKTNGIYRMKHQLTEGMYVFLGSAKEKQVG